MRDMDGASDVGSAFIEIEDGTRNVVISLNNLHDSLYGYPVAGGRRGVAIVIDPGAGFDAPKNIVITGNTLREIHQPIIVHAKDDNNPITNISITNNTITSSVVRSVSNSYGIHIISGSSIRLVKGFVIAGNTIEGYYNNINVDRGYYGKINNNITKDSYSHGFFLLNPFYIDVENNIVDNAGLAVNWVKSINIYCNEDIDNYTSFKGNTLTDSANDSNNYAFATVANCDYVTFSNNVIGPNMYGMSGSNSPINAPEADNHLFEGNIGVVNTLTATDGDYGAEKTVFNNNDNGSGDILQTVQPGLVVGQTRVWYMTAGDATADGAVLTFATTCDPAIWADKSCTCTFDVPDEHLSVTWNGYYWRFDAGYSCTAAD